VPVHSLSSRSGCGTPEGSLWTGCFSFESSSGVCVQEVYPQFKYVISAIAQFYINWICVYRDVFVMLGIRIACSRCVRSVGDNKAPETWPFSMEFVPKGEPEGCEWRGRERGSLHPLQMGAGVRSLLQKYTVFVLGLMTWLSDCFVQRVSSKPPNVCICLVMRVWINSANTVCVLYCDVSGCSVTSHQILPPTRAHSWD
jgi:hypothetical protein